MDELNSAIGVLLAERLPKDVRGCLTGAQHDLFDLGGELSVPGHAIMRAAHIRRLEVLLDRFNARSAAAQGLRAAGRIARGRLAHVARTVCRRAERRVVALAARDAAPAFAISYLNRLSDLLFVVARVLNRRAGRGDVLWQPGKNETRMNVERGRMTGRA